MCVQAKSKTAGRLIVRLPPGGMQQKGPPTESTLPHRRYTTLSWRALRAVIVLQTEIEKKVPAAPDAVYEFGPWEWTAAGNIDCQPALGWMQ